MQLMSLALRSSARRVRVAALAAGLIAVGACQGGEDTAGPPAGPNIPADGPEIPQLTRAAFLVDVNLAKGEIRITPPEETATLNASLGKRKGPDAAGLSASLLGKDVVEVQAQNLFASLPGAVEPNKIRVTFDVRVLNKLTTAELTTSTIPTPPARQNGLVLFPFSTVVTTTPGDVTVQDDNLIVVELPSSGAAAPSIDFNGNGNPDKPSFPLPPGVGGAPHSFFNDLACSVQPADRASDCYRYETFGVIDPATTSEWRRIGFDIDASVRQFRVKMIAAADIRPVSVPQATIILNIANPNVADFSSGTAILSGAGGGSRPLTGNTATWTVNLDGTARQITFGGFTGAAAGCTYAPVSVTPNQATQTINYSPVCPGPGTVTGTINRTGAGTQSLAAALIRVDTDPVGAPFVDQAIGSATFPFSFSVPSIPLGAGTVTVANLPSGCTLSPASQAYPAITLGAPIQAIAGPLTINCETPQTQVSVVVNQTLTGGATGVAGQTLTFAPAPSGTATVTSAALGATFPQTVTASIGAIGNGTGTVSVTALPAGCTASGGAWTGLTTGATVTATPLNVTCAPPRFIYSARFANISGGDVTSVTVGTQVYVELTFDSQQFGTAQLFDAWQGAVSFSGVAFTPFTGTTFPIFGLSLPAGADDFSLPTPPAFSGTDVLTSAIGPSTTFPNFAQVYRFRVTPTVAGTLTATPLFLDNAAVPGFGGSPLTLLNRLTNVTYTSDVLTVTP